MPLAIFLPIKALNTNAAVKCPISHSRHLEDHNEDS